jgi:hypothetical protein
LSSAQTITAFSPSGDRANPPITAPGPLAPSMISGIDFEIRSKGSPS